MTNALTRTDENTSDQDKALDAAIEKATPRLVESLQREERTRRQLRRLLLGGLVMLLFVVSLTIVVAINEPDAQSPVSTTDQPDISQLVEDVDRLWKLGKHEATAEIITALVKRGLAPANLWNNLGWRILLSQPDPDADQRDKASKAFLEALKIDASHAAALNGIGRLAFMRRDFKEAERWFVKAKNAPDAQVTLVKIYLLTNRFAEAKTLAEQILPSYPAESPTPAVHSYRSLIMKMGVAAEVGELTDSLRQQIEPKPAKQGDLAKAQTLSQKGWQLWGQRKMHDAERAFIESIGLDDTNANAHNGLGWALIGQQKAAEAQPHLEKSIELNPHHAGAVNGLAVSLKNQGRVDDAIDVWEKQIAKSPHADANASNLARTYIERGEHAKAMPLLEMVIEAWPNNAEYKKLLERARTDD